MTEWTDDWFGRLTYWWSKRGARWLLRGLTVLLLLAILFLSVTEIGRYLVRAGWEEARILARRRDLDEIVSDSLETPATRGKIALVLDARAFAAADLRLNTGESFTQYSK